MTAVRLVLSGLAAGDSLGSTSEFTSMGEVPATVYLAYRPQGWPFRQVGGGVFGWQPGEPTDDTAMALCIIASMQAHPQFDGDDLGARFVAWAESGPRDIGATTRFALTRVASGTPWYEGGLADFEQNPDNAANGSLMRNAVMAATSVGDLDETFRRSVGQSLITHYAPLPVVCCAAQSYLLDALLRGERPFDGDWRGDFRGRFVAWLEASTDTPIVLWRTRVGGLLAPSLDALETADFDHKTFNPFVIDYRGQAGYCLLTLQIAVWATRWCLDGGAFPTPPGFPHEVFERTGPWVLSWVAMIGADSDTYGATAGPLVAAALGSLPAALTDGLWALRDE